MIPSVRNSKHGKGSVQPFDRNCSEKKANPRTEAGARTMKFVVNYDGCGQRSLTCARLNQDVFAAPVIHEGFRVR